MTCDLHIHSQYSFDGTASLEEICHSAREQGVDIIALTDHCDMLDGPEGISAYLACEQELKQSYAQLDKTGLWYSERDIPQNFRNYALSSLPHGRAYPQNIYG